MLKKLIWGGLGLHWGGVWNGLGTLWAALGRLLLVFFDVQNRAFFKRGSKMGSKSLLARFWEGLGRIWGGFGEEFGRIWTFLCRLWPNSGGIWKNMALLQLGKDFRAFWAILGYSGLFWVIGLFLAALRKIFAGAVCCLLLLSWSLSSKSVLAFACCCLLGQSCAP